MKPRWCESTFRSYSYFWERSMVNNRVALRLQFLKLDHPPPPPCQPFVYPHLGIVRSKCSEVCCLPYMLLFCSIFSLRTCSWSIKLTWLPLKGVCWAIDCVVQLNGHSFGKKWSFHQFAMHQRRGIHTSFLTTLRVACLEINGTLLFVKEAYLQNITTLLNFHSRDA